MHRQLLKAWVDGHAALATLSRLQRTTSFELKVGAVAPNGRRIVCITGDRVYLV